MRLRSLLSICAVSLLMFARTHAGAPGQNPQSTFQAEVNLIEVDAAVTDEQGNSVVGLTIDDFRYHGGMFPKQSEICLTKIESPPVPAHTRNKESAAQPSRA